MTTTVYPSTYFDRFDPTKGYKKLLFLSGNGLQAAELNEIEDVIMGELKRLGNYLVANGTITAGGAITALAGQVATLNSAQIYADGNSVDVAAGAVTILGVGTEVLGIAIDTVIVTQLDDSAITEPDQSSPNYGQVGADRLKMTGQWKLSTAVTTGETFFAVYTLNNGVVISATTSTSTTGTSGLIASALAAYDYSVHGSYVINGLDTSYNSIDGTGDIVMNVAAGRCRVQGNENAYTLESLVELSPMTDVGLVTGEPYIYSGAGTYNLRDVPIQSIQRVVGVKQVTATITRGGVAGSSDLMPNTPVLQIIAVNQGGTWNGTTFTGGTTYVAGTSFTQVGDNISWTGSPQPSPGSSYTAVFQYNAVFVPTFGQNTGVILDGSMVLGTSFTVDYSYFLSRIDLISIDQNGNFVVSKGVPAMANYAQQPQTPPGMLQIAVVTLTYGAVPVVNTTKTTVVTYNQLASMNTAISNLQYNVAQLSLASTAQSNDPTTTKRGIIVDSLVNTALMDAGFAQTAVLSNATLELGSNLTVFANGIQAGLIQGWTQGYPSSAVVQQQGKHTTSETINPYAGAAPVSIATIVLAPASVVCSQWWWYYHGTFLPENTTTTAILSGFNAGETVNVTYRGTLVASGTANGSGAVNIIVPIAAGVQQGSYAITAKGVTSGVVATSIFTIIATDLGGYGYWGQDYTGGALPIGVDPVAQTFQLPISQDLNGVSVWLDQLPNSQLQIKIRPTIAGLPDGNTLLGFGSLQPSQCVLGWNLVPLVYPIAMAANVWYAMVVATSSSVGKVGTAVLGGYDTIGAAYVTSQAANGVFLQSANENTWTPVQNEDMMYKLWSPTYVTTPTTVAITTATVTAATDWVVSANMRIPAGCSVNFYLQDGVGNQYPMSPNNVTFTTPITGTVTLYATLKNSNAGASPQIYAGVGLSAGTATTPGAYVQRQFQIPNGSTSPATIKVFVDVYIPSGASLTVQYQTVAGNPGTWAGISLSTSTAIGNGWFTNSYVVSGVALNAARLQLILATTNAQARPQVQNIRTLLV